MNNSMWKFLADVVEPVTRLIDDIHTSDEERMQLRVELLKVQSALTERLIDYEHQLLAARSSILTAEITGHSWLQCNWRPITMLVFLLLVVLDAFGLLAFRLADEAWTLLQIGLGGYVVGRSVEKIAPTLSKSIQARS